MNNLVAVKRVNKHGVMVTRHVRADNAQTGGLTSMPSPTLGKPVESPREKRDRMALDKRLKRLVKPRNRSLNRKKMGLYGTQALEKFFKTSYKITCSDDDFYTVFEKLRFPDTVILMSAGLKAEQRDLFIERNNFQYYVEDNAELVEGLRSRGIPLESYLAVINNPSLEYRETNFILDAAETHSMYAGDDDSYAKRTLVTYVGGELVQLDDIKALGTERCGYAEFINLLPDFQSGAAKCTASEMADMLERMDKESPVIEGDYDHRLITSVRARSAARYGVEFTETIENPMSVYYAEEEADKMDVEKAMSFLTYTDQATWDEPIDKFDKNDRWRTVAADKKALWEAGIAPEVAREGLESGMRADQIIGIRQHGIEPVVSSGWL